MKITVVGAGYVGLSISFLLAQKHDVTIHDINIEKIKMLQDRQSPIVDYDIERFISNDEIKYIATSDFDFGILESNIIFIATPTDYDSEKQYFNTKSVENVIEQILKKGSKAIIIIKSTIPVGFTEYAREKYQTNNIIFSPEFLREGYALHDNLYPSRIIIGDTNEEAELVAKVLLESANKKDIPVILTNSTEAEAIKLFANTYLAMRIAFFNELDSYAEIKELDTESIIKGVSLDPRIGDHYNNPSFGYGGYCLPKDTKQLLANYSDVPQSIISAIVNANSVRKDHVTEMILRKSPNVVGIFKLTMKANSDNFRSSAVQGIIKRLIKHGVNVVIYEPNYKLEYLDGAKLITDINEFKTMSDVIVANRVTNEISDVLEKIYTRDLFNRD